MTAQWYNNQPRALRRASVAVNSIAIVIIIAFVLAIKLSTKTPVIQVPNPDLPIIEVPLNRLAPPPAIDQDIIPLPFNERPAAVNLDAANGVPQPVADNLATDSTMLSQRNLGGVNPIDPRLIGDPNVIVRIVPPEPEPATQDSAIPERGVFIKTSRNPSPVKLPPPEYPANCRSLGIEGTATIQILLNFDGRVMATHVARSAGNAELDSSAVNAARQAEFIPALGGRNNPVRVWVAVPYHFSLNR